VTGPLGSVLITVLPASEQKTGKLSLRNWPLTISYVNMDHVLASFLVRAAPKCAITCRRKFAVRCNEPNSLLALTKNSRVHSHNHSAFEAGWRNPKGDPRYSQWGGQIRLPLGWAKLRRVQQPSESNGRRGA